MHDDWSLVRLAAAAEGRSIAIQVPAGSAMEKANLVLVGRKSGREISAPMAVSADEASVDLDDALLATFAGETVDLWVEPIRYDKVTGRRRVTASPAVPVAEQGRPGSSSARWYTTVNNNISVVIPVEAAREQALSGPRLVRFLETDTGAQLAITGVDPSPEVRLGLLIVGRTSRQQLSIPFERVNTELQVDVSAEQLSTLGREPVDVFVDGLMLGTAATRAPIAAAVEVRATSLAGSPRQWYATADGYLGNRPITAVEAIAQAGVFDESYYRQQCPELGPDIDPVEHYLRVGAAKGLNPSSMFDTAYYRRMNPDVRGNPLEHFCVYGWRELRNPSASFDTWWYWSKHLDLAEEKVNPLGHYEQHGKHEGLSTRPSATPSRNLGAGFRLPKDQPIRRICLFAAYDPDGVVDDYVIDYVSELSRHADVYYWADCDMPQSELDKLAGITRQAWAERHGEYDFGSYSRLIKAVGWDAIEGYDELMLVNDSCYLLRPLDDVFDTMNDKACDWWGLQATKGIFQTRRAAVNQFRDPIPMESARGALVDAFERDYTYDFHVGSYFLVYRRPVLDDGEFRRYLGAVTMQTRKRNIVKKYEVGLTRWLIQHGHQFDTFVSKIYPFHPLFSQWHFRLIDEGFPLFKRYLLTENHYNVPNLWNWTERVAEKVPEADVEMFERNLKRITDPETLRRNLHVGRTYTMVDDTPVADRLLSPAEFIEADRTSPKHANWWTFPVCAFSHTLSGNERAIFEEVKDDPRIRKIILVRDKEVRVDGVNVEVLPLQSPEGQHRLMRSGTILIRHSRNRNLVYPVSSELHNLIQVWHGIPFKRIGYASSDFLGVLDRIVEDQAQYRAVISSSKIDALAMTAAFYPLTYHQVWNTGLPRNDFILRNEDDLPSDLRTELEDLRTIVDGRRLVLFMPTFRNSQSEGSYRFSADELGWLRRWLDETGSVLGVREHMADHGRAYGAQFAELPMIDVSDQRFPNVEVLYRASDALITDYSSAFIDYMLTGKPMVSFAYDYEAYLLERGGFYDLEQVFPGPICKSFDELKGSLVDLFARTADPLYDFRRRMFFDHVDDRSSARVVERLRDLSEVGGLGKWLGERLA